MRLIFLDFFRKKQESIQANEGGRKVLHVGNVANLAFVNARLLNKMGYNSHMISPDFYHFASSPEWQDMVKGDVDRKILGDDWFPDFRGKSVPIVPSYDWVSIGPTHLAITYLYFLINKDPRAKLARACLEYQKYKTAILKSTLPQSTTFSRQKVTKLLDKSNVSRSELRKFMGGHLSDSLLAEFRRVVESLYGEETAKQISPPLAYANAVAYAGTDKTLGKLWRDLNGSGDIFGTGVVMDPKISAEYEIHPDVRPEDAAPYLFTLSWWKALFDCYDEVVLYGSFASLGLLTGIRYHAYEHGNIRAIPFQDNSLGRLTKLAYLNAENVFITNTDYLIAKPRLNIEIPRRKYIPHAFEEKIVFDFKKMTKFKRPKNKAKFFFPSRQDWYKDDPSLNKGNDLVYRAVKKLIDEGISNFSVTCVDWGQDADRSRALIDELGISDYISWVSPMPKGALWRSYLNSSCVLDQFRLDAFGGVTYESLAFGCRVITRDDGIANKEFFDNDPPPIFAAKTIDEIYEHMKSVIDDPSDEKGLGEAATEWVKRKHSSRAIYDIMENTFDQKELQS